MVGIEPPGLDRLPEGPVRDLVLALHALYRGSGKPSTRRIASRVQNGDYRDTVSHETIAAMLHGDRGVPRWEKLEAVVSVLALLHTPPLDPTAEATRMQEFWHAAQGHANLDETARDIVRMPAAAPSAVGAIEAPADPAGPAQWEFNEPPAVFDVAPRATGRSARQFLPRLWMRLRSYGGRWRAAAVACVAVIACVAGIITGLRLTGGAASQGLRITAAVTGNQPEVFAITTAHVLEYDSFRSGTGSGWQQMPGGGRYLGTPATVTDSTGRLEVFARTVTGTIVRFYQSAPGVGSWDRPERLGAERFTSNPSVANWTHRGLVVVARLADGLLGIDTQAGTGLTAPWSGWDTFGTTTIGQPAAVANHGDGHPEVFAVASGSGSLVHTYNQGNGWKPWHSLAAGAVFTGVPAVSEDATGRAVVFARTPTGSVEPFWQSHPGHGKWKHAYPIGSGIAGDLELLAVGGGQLELFAERGGGSLEYSTQVQANSAEWSAWTSLPGHVNGMPAVVYVAARTDIVASMGGGLCDIHSVGASGWSGCRPLSGA